MLFLPMLLISKFSPLRHRGFQVVPNFQDHAPAGPLIKHRSCFSTPVVVQPSLQRSIASSEVRAGNVMTPSRAPRMVVYRTGLLMCTARTLFRLGPFLLGLERITGISVRVGTLRVPKGKVARRHLSTTRLRRPDATSLLPPTGGSLEQCLFVSDAQHDSFCKLPQAISWRSSSAEGLRPRFTLIVVQSAKHFESQGGRSHSRTPSIRS